jgi:hypothetical protein
LSVEAGRPIGVQAAAMAVTERLHLFDAHRLVP